MIQLLRMVGKEEERKKLRTSPRWAVAGRPSMIVLAIHILYIHQDEYV